MSGRGSVQNVPAARRSAALPHPRAVIAAKALLAAGLLAYPLTPLDLIPNRLPVIGYADQVGFVLAGLALVYMLLVPRVAIAGAPGWAMPSFGSLRARATGWLRARILDWFAWAFARPILRLSTGAWPSGADIGAFRHAFRRFTPLPPLLRALATVPAGRHQLTRAMLASWLLADETYRGAMRDELQPANAATGNCLHIWTGPKVTFLHLEKTAGMAVTEVLTAQFHPLQIDADLRRTFPPHVLTPLPPFLLDRVRRCALVWGHYDVPSINRLGNDRFTFTMLREPRERILSLYYYWRGQASLDLGWKGMNQPVLAAQRLTLAEFLNTDDPMITDYIDNFYVRRLTGQYRSGNDIDPLAEAPGTWKEAALEALARFDFVGLTEDTRGAMVQLGARLGFTAPKRVPRVNVTQGERAPAHGPEVEAALERLTRLDRDVYAAAVARQ